MRDLKSNIIQPNIHAGLDDRLGEVRRKRFIAFMLDFAFIILLCIPSTIVIAILGLLTFSIGWMLFPIILPLTAAIYIGLTAGGAKQATLGMQMSGIQLERMDGKNVNAVLAIVHAALGWTIHVVATPFLAIISLFADHKRLLHDILLGTVVTRT